jgi:hypothetical protein
MERLLFAVAATLILGGCGGVEEGGSGGYLARDDSGAAYLQWTRYGNQATGSPHSLVSWQAEAGAISSTRTRPRSAQWSMATTSPSSSRADSAWSHRGAA